MKPLKKMRPQDYPIFGFRLAKARKEEIEGLLKKVDQRLNGKLGVDDRRTPKNKILYQALKEGLTKRLKR